MRLAASFADHVLTFSDYCRGSIADTYGVSIERITATLHGCNHTFNPRQPINRVTELRKEYDLPTRFVLYVGRLNIE